MKKIRNNGAIGALLDEYEKAVREIMQTIEDLTEQELKQVVDKDTSDHNCVSIQSILSHVVRAGNNYVVAIRKYLGEQTDYISEPAFDSVQEYQDALMSMFQFNEKFFEDYPGIQLEEYDEDKKIKVRWGQKYDVEQLFEHAIVHVLRHRRQIERFKIRIRLMKEKR